MKGYAQQEQEVLTRVTEARARVGQMQVTPETLNDPAALQRFQQAQGDLSSALSRLLVVVEKYPDLKSDQNFRDLQAQLEGTENRIAVARNRYIKTVQDYNVLVREFPVNLTAHGVRLQDQAQLHRRERARDLDRAQGRLRQAGGEEVTAIGG